MAVVGVHAAAAEASVQGRGGHHRTWGAVGSRVPIPLAPLVPGQLSSSNFMAPCDFASGRAAPLNINLISNSFE